MRRLAVLSMHTSPLVEPGAGVGGGMNVYVREVVSALAEMGGEATVFTRRTDNQTPEIIELKPGFQVVQIEAGDVDLSKEDLPSFVDMFADRVAEHLARSEFDALFANYWLSAEAGHQLKHRLDLPLVTVFHTLARVKSQNGDSEPQSRMDGESAVIRCSDVILANSSEEVRQLTQHYGAEPSRIEVVPPGVDHSIFSPGCQDDARQQVGIGGGPVLLFVGRIQPLKGLDIAVRTLAELGNLDAQLVVIGDSSGPDGPSEAHRVRALVDRLGLSQKVLFVEPRDHKDLPIWYRASDVVLMPSRSESFGLVALEAAACGIPVVAASVGGLRSVICDRHTGFLVEGREPVDYAAHVSWLLDNTAAAAEMAMSAAEHSWSYTWPATAARLRRVCDDLLQRSLVDCA